MNDFIYAHGDHCLFFACRLKHALSLTALGVNEDAYRIDLKSRQSSFLNNLVNSRDERITYDLRFVLWPDLELYTRGRVELALICRLAGWKAVAARAFGRNCLNLLNASFREYEFETVPAADVGPLLEPFELNEVIEIKRRSSFERLDSLLRRAAARAIGFSASSIAKIEAARPQISHDVVFHVFPFIPTGSSFGALFNLCLRESSPIALSCRLRPTCLSAEEESFFESQITRCEKAVHAASAFSPTLSLQARIFERYQVGRLFGMRDNAALATIEIGSPSPLPQGVVDSVGSLVTEAAGGRVAEIESGLERYLAGGYEAVHLQTPAAKDAFVNLDISPPPIAPSVAYPARLPYLYDSNECAAFFRFPPATLEPPLGLSVRNWRSQMPPKDIPDQGSFLGIARHGGAVQKIILAPEDRNKHVYAVGQTGTGKTTILETMILEDIRTGAGLCVIDPHGDLFRDLLGKIPDNRIDDVVVFDPTDTEYPVGLNMLECGDLSSRFFIAQELVGIIRRLIQDEYGRGTDFIGPIFFQHMRMNLLLAMSNPADPGTFLEFYNIYVSPSYWKRWLPLKTEDPFLSRWVSSVLPNTDYVKGTSDGVSVGSYIGSKFENFVFDPVLRNIFGQKRSAIDLAAIMDEGKIFLVNLARGELTEENSRFLGMILLAKIMAAAMGRVKIPREKRRQFSLFVDEFQSFATESFVTLASEARKFALNLVLANQFLTQITNPRILQAVFGNVGTIISFRLGQDDAELLERKFLPTFNRWDLVNLPNWNAYITTLINGQTVRPFSFETVLDQSQADEKQAQKVRARSRERYSRPRAEVEKEIAESLKVVVPLDLDKE